jgi:hypothetical protein
MAQMVPGTTTLARLIACACSRGCELRRSSLRIITADGEVDVRYLFNPSNGGRFMVGEYDDDELISPEVWENAERRLDLRLREH